MDNLKGDAATRSRQLATGAIKSKFRADGGRFADFRISDHRKAIAELAASEEILTRAQADVARFAKFRSFAQRRRR
jgi:hypothetical protein